MIGFLDHSKIARTSRKAAPIRPSGTFAVHSSKRGSALVVVLWILMIIALIVGSFSFEMQLESRIITLQRKRFKADQLALAGVELAKSMIFFKEEENTTGEKIIYEDPFKNEAIKIVDAIPVDFSEEFGDGIVKLHIDYEKGRRNIAKMTAEDWKEIFEQAGIPNTKYDEMIGCLDDWQDENDDHRINGAESDDPFYKKRGYECKNAPVDTVDELLLIKNWGEEVLYGTSEDKETDTPIRGIANKLTVWGDGRVNPNSASLEVLQSMTPLLSEDQIATILEARLGLDGEAGTADDGITEKDFAALGLDGGRFTVTPEYVAITSIGQVGDIQSKISCIFKLGDKDVVPLFWLEGAQKEPRH